MGIESVQQVICDRCGGAHSTLSTGMNGAELRKHLVAQGNWSDSGKQLVCALCRALAGDFGKESQIAAQRIRRPKT